MSESKIEFAVQMTCDSCVEAVKRNLDNIPGIKSFDINLETNTVVVNTILPTLEVYKQIELSGRNVSVKGYAGSSAGVAILDTGEDKVKGVVRFVQVNPNTCLIDGTIDGLSPGTHNLSVHECGDISNGCKSVGKIFDLNKIENVDKARIYGDLGSVNAANHGRATFRLEDNVLNLSSIIGRSLVVSQGNDQKRLACGIIARSAGLFENPKTICACDGVTMWNEKINPKAAL